LFALQASPCVRQIPMRKKKARSGGYGEVCSRGNLRLGNCGLWEFRVSVTTIHQMEIQNEGFRDEMKSMQISQRNTHTQTRNFIQRTNSVFIYT